MAEAPAPRPWRLSRRLAWRLSAVMLLAMAMAAGAVAWRTLATIRSLDDAALQRQAELVAAGLSAGPDGRARLDLSDQLAGTFAGSEHDSLFVVYDAGGAVLFTSDRAGAAAVAPYRPAGEGFFRVPRSAQFRHGLLGVQVAAAPWTVVVAQAHEQQEVLVASLLGEFLGSVVWLLLAMGVATVAIAVLTTRHGLRPLRDASAAAARVGPGHPHVRLPAAGMPGELSPLVGAVNAALERLERALEAHRRFVGDAAHALRTPLAILIARIDALPEGGAAAELRADADRMRRLVEQMLTLSRLEGAPLDVSGPVDLRAVATEAISGRAPLAIARDVALSLDVAEGVRPVRGNHAALVIALENLLDNAIALAPAGSAVEVEIAAPAAVHVRDRGPGLPEEGGEEIFQRFHARRRGGIGLGLAIVAETVAAHGGSVRAEPRPGGGADFVIRLAGGG